MLQYTGSHGHCGRYEAYRVDHHVTLPVIRDWGSSPTISADFICVINILHDSMETKQENHCTSMQKYSYIFSRAGICNAYIQEYADNM